MFKWTAIAGLLALTLLLGCAQEASHTTREALVAHLDEPALSPDDVAAAVLAAMDRDVEPCQDFYRYACGGWLDSTELPGDEPHWIRSFSEISKRNLELSKEILEQSVESDDPDLARLGRFYASCMNEDRIERLRLRPVYSMLRELTLIDNMHHLYEDVGRMHRVGNEALFELEVFGDPKNPELSILNLSQGGLGLPDRDYYLDPRMAGILTQYERHVANMFVLTGDTEEEATDAASAVLGFETELAGLSRTRARMRNVEEQYNRLDRAGLQKLMPTADWNKFFSIIGYPKLTQINVGTPEFFEGLEQLITVTELEHLQHYMRWRMLHYLADRLPRKFVEEHFAFYGAKLAGQAEPRPRWRLCVDATSTSMGELLGHAFVERHFDDESRAIASTMVRDVEEAFESGLAALEWMDDSTRERARKKRQAIVNKTGYPDRWRDASELEVHEDDYLGNTIRAARLKFDRETGRVGKPVDRTEWSTSPHAVDARYNPRFNETVFPAGILQKPLFHRDYPPAMNFGGIGVVMGHELTHGFYGIGSKFDSRGKMEPWWSDSVIRRFNVRTQCLAVQSDLFANGQLTQDESIADLGGIKVAYRAYRASTAGAAGAESYVEELTDDQLFFVNFAQSRCMHATPEFERLPVTVDSRSAGRLRVIGPLSGSPEFAAAFGCATDTPMNPARKCEVW